MSYPDESGIASPLPVFDRDGVLTRIVEVGAPTGKMTEANGGPFESAEEAEAYARFLGATEVKIVRTKTRNEALAKARATRRKETIPA